MEWDQFKSLISKLERDGEYKFCLLISVGVFTGLRVSDLLQLKFNQFIGTEFLNIIEKKTKKDRRIKINSDLKDIVERIKLKMNVINDEQFIFVNKYGTKPIDKSYVNVKLKELFKKYNPENKIIDIEDKKNQLDYWNEKLDQELGLTSLLGHPLSMELVRSVLALPNEAPVKMQMNLALENAGKKLLNQSN